jgi:hypothetical protein
VLDYADEANQVFGLAELEGGPPVDQDLFQLLQCIRDHFLVITSRGQAAQFRNVIWRQIYIGNSSLLLLNKLLCIDRFLVLLQIFDFPLEIMNTLSPINLCLFILLMNRYQRRLLLQHSHLAAQVGTPPPLMEPGIIDRPWDLFKLIL